MVTALALDWYQLGSLSIVFSVKDTSVPGRGTNGASMFSSDTAQGIADSEVPAAVKLWGWFR